MHWKTLKTIAALVIVALPIFGCSIDPSYHTPPFTFDHKSIGPVTVVAPNDPSQINIITQDANSAVISVVVGIPVFQNESERFLRLFPEKKVGIAKAFTDPLVEGFNQAGINATLITSDFQQKPGEYSSWPSDNRGLVMAADVILETKMGAAFCAVQANEKFTPSVIVEVRVISLKRNEVLYQDKIAYGGPCAPLFTPGSGGIRLPGESDNLLIDHDEMFANPNKAAEMLRRGARQITHQVLEDLVL